MSAERHNLETIANRLFAIREESVVVFPLNSAVTSVNKSCQVACLPLGHYASYQRRKHPRPTTAVSTADVPNVRSPISTAKLSLYSRDANNGFMLYKLHAYNVNGLTPFHECSSFHSFVLYPILVANCYICALIVNECTIPFSM